MKFTVSVIIPIYNASAFIEKALDSCWLQPEVKEVIVVNDGSTDNSLEILKQIALRESRLKIYQHEGFINKGRSASRNIGIKNATQSYIAFLDADDYYLENRFKNDAEILLNNPEVDGVYNAIGIHFYESYTGRKDIFKILTTMTDNILPENLFENMGPFGDKGWFSGDGLTVKKEALLKVGLFNESLIVAEDTELWVKLTLMCNLMAGNIVNPVAKRGIHADNVFYLDKEFKRPRLIMYQSLLTWSIKNNLEDKRVKLIVNKFISYLHNYASNNIVIFNKFWFITFFKNFKIKYSILFLKGYLNYYNKYLKRLFRN